MYQEQYNKEKEKARSPLNLVAFNSKKDIRKVPPKDGQTPKILRLVSQSTTPTPEYSSAKKSTVVQPINNEGTKIQDLTCIEQNESKTVFIKTNSCKHPTTLIKPVEDEKQQVECYQCSSPRPLVESTHQNDPNSLSNLHGHAHAHSHLTSNTTIATQGLPSITDIIDDSIVVTKAEITPERSSLPCGSRKRKLLFEPSSDHSESSSSPATSRQEVDDNGPSKRKRTGIPASSKRRPRLKERVGQIAPSPGSLRHCKRKGMQNKTPQVSLIILQVVNMWVHTYNIETNKFVVFISERRKTNIGTAVFQAKHKLTLYIVLLKRSVLCVY